MFLEALLAALRGMRANKLRTALTALGNVLAVGALVTIVALVEGVDQDVTRAILARGADVFYVERYGPVTTDEEWERVRDRPPLREEDAEAIRHGVPLAAAVLTSRRFSAALEAGRERVDDVRIVAHTAEYPRFIEEDLAAGRHYTEAEARRAAPVAVLGADAAAALFPGGPAVGRTIKIDGQPVTVIGVLEPQGALLGQTQDRYVYVPFEFASAKWGRPSSVRISVKPRAPELLDLCADEARAALRARRKLRPADEDPFAITAATTYLQMYRRATRAIYGALVGLVALALLVGGIIIANVMLMVVAQRTREIGIRRAAGARRSQVLAQFLVESAVLSLAGGLAGLGLGFLATRAAQSATSLRFPVEPWSIAVGFALVLVVGVVAGFYPARRAARMDPVVALRYER